MTQDGTLEQSYILSGIPMPPTDNHLFLNIPRRGRVKSPGYRRYEKDFEIWRLTHLRELGVIKKAVRGSKMAVSFMFNFEYGQLHCKDGRIKRLDVQNRLKAICDLLSAALETDDRFFFEVAAKKVCGYPTLGVEAKIKVLESISVSS